MFVGNRSPITTAAGRRSGSALRRRVAALLMLVILALPGCVSAQSLVPHPVPDLTAPATVFVADGAGNFQIASRNLRAVVQCDGYPLQIITFDWSHGYGRVVADQVCYSYARAKGKQLACDVLAYHAEHPDLSLYLIGHSAGSAVVLAALENLPPDVIERAIILSPSLSAAYDLQPALAAVKCGLHVFYSKHDYWYLGMVTGVLGTSDRRWLASSGRYGFDVQAEGEDSRLHAKLYQRSWHPCDIHLGNLGGHYGNYQPEFLRAYIIPLLQPTAPAPH